MKMDSKVVLFSIHHIHHGHYELLQQYLIQQLGCATQHLEIDANCSHDFTTNVERPYSQNNVLKCVASQCLLLFHTGRDQTCIIILVIVEAPLLRLLDCEPQTQLASVWMGH